MSKNKEGTAALGGTLLAGCGTQASAVPSKWDATTDVVVIGFGGAGACAAIAAVDAGSSVIVLEKSPIPDGGNTGCSTGLIHTAPFADQAEWTEKIIHGVYGTVPKDTIGAMVSHALSTPVWLEKIGINLKWTPIHGAANSSIIKVTPNMPLRYSIGTVASRKGSEGRFLWEAIREVVESRHISVHLGTPAKELIQNPITKEIIGVKAKTAAGEDYYVKALKGVVMALGGYENNAWKQGQYNQPGVRLYPWGTPYNTGDGIDMACRVGASLWHLHALEWSSVNFRLASEKANCSVSTNSTTGITPYNHIFVNQFGKRFMNESKNMNHDISTKRILDFDPAANEYANLPFYLVFDSTMFNKGPLYTGSGRSGVVNTYAGVQGLCDWGPDNARALERGWIFSGKTVEELAASIKGTTPSEKEVGCDRATLAKTIADFNRYAIEGVDPEFGRPAKKMAPLESPPYYAIEMGLSTINTQGGAQRNGNCQVLDVEGQPIPRLFSAGEFGSLNGYVYVFGNIFEALTTGHVAGEQVAQLKAWEAEQFSVKLE